MDSFANHPYAAFLDKVEKPARYAGGEAGQVRKDWASVRARVCLAFPDVYDIGMSHLGYKILYKILNDDPRTLAERCYAPWVDMEAELRRRGLPLVSLESARPLREFDVVGLSLQFELTYTNCLTMLDLGGIPLRSSARGEADPLVLAGGPTATHPESVSAFFDAIVVGDGEERLLEVALAWTELRDAGVPRAERLRRLATQKGVYVPSLYTVSRDPESRMLVVDRPGDPELPFPVERAFVPDLSKFPFPDGGPIGGPEAIFDRMSVEIARGCTEGCRFCQAGMIYRPVRERDPQEIVDTVVSAVNKSGFDEVSLSSLSTADYSCISPLIKKVVEKLEPERVSLGVSSLRAYGLDEDVLDELGKVRSTGLTFAPEAGTQRMRDVVNKNVTEEQLLETAHRVFSRGWGRMKLYFMIGLPTEEDEDVRGIVGTGFRAQAVGKKLSRGKAQVTVSVSSHVPKPHTPFQWCAMDSVEEIRRKQRLLQSDARAARVELRTHEVEGSVLEGIFARGDRSLCDVIEHAYLHGARFDSWDDQLRLDVWQAAFERFGVDTSVFLGTIPVTARLPWDHLSVGLEDGFLAKEYRKSLKSRLSPPCGKTVGQFVHPTNLEDHFADQRPLVCYDCGVACDLTQMRREREVFLGKLGAEKRLPVVQAVAPPSPAPQPGPSKKNRPPVRTSQGTAVRYRFRFEKVGPTALLSHLDIVRALPRVFRRIGVPMAYSLGFHPKPEMVFTPALSLGVPSLGEIVDVKLLAEIDPGAVLDAMNSGAPEGLVFRAGTRLGPDDPAITKVIGQARYLFAIARAALADVGGDAWLEERVRWALAQPKLEVRREMNGLAKYVDVRSYLEKASLGDDAARALVARTGLVGDLVVLDATVRIAGSGGTKAAEVIEAITGDKAFPSRPIRAALAAEGGTDPMDLEAIRQARARAKDAKSAEGVDAPALPLA